MRAGEPLTAATDVYGLALVARELLGGRPEDPFVGRVLRRSLDPRPRRRHQRPRSFAVAFAAAVVMGQELDALRERRDQLAALARRAVPGSWRPRRLAAALSSVVERPLADVSSAVSRARSAGPRVALAELSTALGAAGRVGPRPLMAAGCAAIVVVALAMPRLSPAAAGIDRVELPAASPLARVAYALPPLGAHAAQFESQAAYPSAAAGAPVSWTVAIRNTGSAGWERGIAGAQAALALADGTVVAVQTTAYVGPGQVGWFIARFRAPAEPGAHIVPLRLVIEGAGPLADLGIHAVVTVPR